MQKIFITILFSFFSGFMNSADMSLIISEKVEISSDRIEIKEDKIKFKNNLIFQSKSYEIFGEIAEYDRKMNMVKIFGSPVRFKIINKDNSFEGFSDKIILKENEIEISGSVFIEDNSSNIKGETIKFNIISKEIEVG